MRIIHRWREGQIAGWLPQPLVAKRYNMEDIRYLNVDLLIKS
ncbi:hypothetical protein D1AOALGA4SA_883 [Olavius algarvensis Delta 1 endosymbiont]|nr:hypothetical protein D1AOALGA4SA_883 [Olavius algarvensis Delta 1 endosymbiont]